MEIEKETCCCFFGHRKIVETEGLEKELYEKIEELIVKQKVRIFLFGSKSRFDDLCLRLVTQIKEKYPHIKRIYVRAEFPYINADYRDHLLNFYEETYYPERILGAGKASYVERNYEMIDKSLFCIIYYDENCPYKSGTKIAYTYALKNEKKIYNAFRKT